eukprot:7632447-Heterocapsa_arctica.AAC.1
MALRSLICWTMASGTTWRSRPNLAHLSAQLFPHLLAFWSLDSPGLSIACAGVYMTCRWPSPMPPMSSMLSQMVFHRSTFGFSGLQHHFRPLRMAFTWLAWSIHIVAGGRTIGNTALSE